MLPVVPVFEPNALPPRDKDGVALLKNPPVEPPPNAPAVPVFALPNPPSPVPVFPALVFCPNPPPNPPVVPVFEPNDGVLPNPVPNPVEGFCPNALNPVDGVEVAEVLVPNPPNAGLFSWFCVFVPNAPPDCWVDEPKPPHVFV